MSPQGKVAIITGASSGFGREAALLAAKRGYRVVAAARLVERLEALVREITSQGGTAASTMATTPKMSATAQTQRLPALRVATAKIAPSRPSSPNQMLHSLAPTDNAHNQLASAGTTIHSVTNAANPLHRSASVKRTIRMRAL